MSKKIILGMAFVLVLVPSANIFAGKMELATYYPSPNGEYDALQVGTLSTGIAQPARDGDILLRPQTGDPAIWPVGQTGQFAYSADDDALYHYDGANWVKDSPPVRVLPKTDQVEVYRPGDNGTYQTGYSGTRFTDHGDGTATDNATGLTWVKNPAGLGAPFNGSMTWANAITQCENLNYAGHTDWRLPNVRELMSMVNYDKAALGPQPANNPLGACKYSIFSIGFNIFWSSTSNAGDTTNAWGVIFRYGHMPYYAKTTNLRAWPVRGG